MSERYALMLDIDDLYILSDALGAAEMSVDEPQPRLAELSQEVGELLAQAEASVEEDAMEVKKPTRRKKPKK